MTTSLLDVPSGLRGVQRPRLANFPSYVSSAGDDAIECAALAGLELDEWQRFVLSHSLGEQADGLWAASQVGLVVPRQNGKGSILEARELAGLFLLGERLIIHSAHEQATSSEHFRRLLQLIESVPEFEQRVLKAPKGKGMEAIELRNGQRILFKTRTKGGGRGTSVDLLVMDEAMFLSESALAALTPTLSASPNPQSWYVGSAVDQREHEDGYVLARVRQSGLNDGKRVAYFEHSAPGDDPSLVSDAVRSDPAMWATANPGLGIRISPQHIETEIAGALGPREFAVERLGIGDWPNPEQGRGNGIPVEAWRDLADARSSIAGPVTFALDVTPDRGWSTIVAAGHREDGVPHVEVVQRGAGTGWVVERLVELEGSHDCLGVVFDRASPAASLEGAISELSSTVHATSSSEYAQACGSFFDAVTEGALRHLGTPDLEGAVKGAVKRTLGDAFAWSRKGSAVDISPLVAATLAHWFHINAEPEATFTFEVFA